MKLRESVASVPSLPFLMNSLLWEYEAVLCLRLVESDLCSNVLTLTQSVLCVCAVVQSEFQSSCRPAVTPEGNLFRICRSHTGYTQITHRGRKMQMKCFCTLNLSSGVRLIFISRFSICLNFFCSFLTSPI